MALRIATIQNGAKIKTTVCVKNIYVERCGDKMADTNCVFLFLSPPATQLQFSVSHCIEL